MKPPTLQEIAREAGVHRTTVSLALRNDPRLPPATRKRLQAFARDMGYVPNPLVSALMKYRSSGKAPPTRGLMAFLTAFDTETAWRDISAYARMFEGAQRRAAEQGFQLDPIWLRQPGMNARQLNRIFYHRNIHAAIVCPVPDQCYSLEWVEWDRFSSITIGHSLKSPLLHRVSHDYYHAMFLALEQVQAMGSKRIGLILHQSANDRVDHLWLAAYLAKRYRSSRDNLSPPLLVRENFSSTEARRVLRYFQTSDMDTVLLQPSFIRIIEAKFPADVLPHVVNLGCYDATGEDIGIYQNYENIGAEAVNQLLVQLHSSERGIPLQSRDILIRGLWSSGK